MVSSGQCFGCLLGVTLLLNTAGFAQSPHPTTVLSGDTKADSPSGSSRQNSKQVVDLSHAFDQRAIYWPTEDGFQLIVGTAGVTERGYYYSANRFAAAEHGGTHIDAPIHFSRNGETVDQIPLEKLIGEAVVIDLQKACAEDRDYQVSISDLRDWETSHHRQLVDVIVLLRTGFGRFWEQRESYLGTKEKGSAAVEDLHFPGLDPAAAQWLVEHRAIKAIGIDTASIDYGQSRKFQSHVTLFENGIPAFENVANLDQLPSQGTTVFALPMKIAGGSGAPLRIVAVLEK